tara:strand:- start:897 stop:1088 length:192 start_codon:yes stop_codon:yes gene_type:complete
MSPIQIEYDEFYDHLENIGVDFVITSNPEKTPSYKRLKGTYISQSSQLNDLKAELTSEKEKSN